MLTSSNATALLHAFHLALNEESGSALQSLLPSLNDLPISMQGQAMQAYIASSASFPVVPLIRAMPWASWDAEGLWRAAERGQAARVRALLNYFPSAGRNDNHLPLVFACSGLNPQCMSMLWPRANEDTRVKAISRFLGAIGKDPSKKTPEVEKWGQGVIIHLHPDTVHSHLGSTHSLWSLYDAFLAQAMEQGAAPAWNVAQVKCLSTLPLTQMAHESCVLQDTTPQLHPSVGKTRRI